MTPSNHPQADYLGLHKDTALAKAAAENLQTRIIQEDETHFAVTKDFRPDRLNFVIIHGLVTSVTRG